MVSARARKRSALPALFLLVGVATGCSSEHDGRPDVEPAPIVTAACPRTEAELGGRTPQKPGGAIPAGFSAVQVIWCAPSDRVAPAGRDGPSYEERLAPVSAGFLAAMGLPDRVDDGAVCPASVPEPTYVMLADAEQRAIHVRLPLGPCGELRAEVRTELRALSFTVNAEFSIPLR